MFSSIRHSREDRNLQMIFPSTFEKWVFTVSSRIHWIQWTILVKCKNMGHMHHNFQENGDLVSPWHDIPLYNTEDRSNQTLNMVVEIPRFTQVRIMSSSLLSTLLYTIKHFWEKEFKRRSNGQAKFEINREEGLNPIKQDLESGKPRCYSENVKLQHIKAKWRFPQMTQPFFSLSTFWIFPSHLKFQDHCWKVPSKHFPNARAPLQLWSSATDLGESLPHRFLDWPAWRQGCYIAMWGFLEGSFAR